MRLDAELVVDASGRSGATLRQLEKLGYAKPVEESIGVDIGYATRVFRQPDDGRDWKCMAVYTTAPRTHRLGVVFPIEGDRWIVTLVGLRGHYPRSDDDAAFLDFAASLEQPDLYEAIRNAEPEGPVRLIGYANQMRRRFERLERFPAGLLYLGDSICGYKCHFGNQVTAANVNIFGTKEPLSLKTGGTTIPLGRRKIGIVMGDYCQVGCNSVSDPATFLLPRTIVYSLSRINSGIYGPDEILKNKPMERGVIERAPLKKK